MPGSVLATFMRVSNSALATGPGPQEPLLGHHGDVVMSGDRAWWFYSDNDRRTAIDVVELEVRDGKLLAADPAQPTYIDLKPDREREK